MSYCRNCKKNIAKYECLICNCSYCLRCDSYIHSFPSKRLHKRNYISILNTDNINNTDYNYNNRNNNFQNLNSHQTASPSNLNISIPIQKERESSNNMVEEIQDQHPNILLYTKRDTKEPKEQIPENENLNEDDILEYNNNNYYERGNEYDDIIDHDIYLKKISSLGSEIIDTKENFDNRIEALHEHFHVIDENKKTKMAELNDKNLKEINAISAEKNTQIQQLKGILEEQREIISQLKEERLYLEKIYDNGKKDIEELNYDKQKLSEENKILEDMHIKKINEVMQINQEEKNKLIEEYNEELIKIRNKYGNNLEIFENTFKEKQKDLNDYLEEKRKEQNDLSMMIDSLKMENNNKLQQYNQLKYNYDELEKIYNEKEKQYNEMKAVVVNK